jgi:hypothetical protein
MHRRGEWIRPELRMSRRAITAPGSSRNKLPVSLYPPHPASLTDPSIRRSRAKPRFFVSSIAPPTFPKPLGLVLLTFMSDQVGAVRGRGESGPSRAPGPLVLEALLR